MKSLNKIQAISFAVILFMILHYLLTLGTNYLANNNADRLLIWLPWLNLTAYFLYLFSGVIAGAFSKQHFIIVGLYGGLVSALSAVFMFGVGGGVLEVFVTLAIGLVLGSVGGGLSFLFKRRVTNAL